MNWVSNLLKQMERFQHVTTPFIILLVLIMFLVPVPVFMLDIMIAANFTISLIILLMVMYIPKPLGFSSFPSTLLLTTLFRLSLNIASTRIILLHGHEGTSSAGSVIQAFGQFVAGGEFMIGIIVFAIIIIIQFVVINAGSSRIAEVTARFTLDAMPGKQMSIDADLNSGLIEESEAKIRRQELQDEADFYGAMDGAIKFVSKDAIASMMIVVINIIGGLLFGIIRHDMAPIEAAQTFIILTIGDGLVSSLPSLFISVAGGLLTTRATAKRTLGEDILEQVFGDKKPIAFASGSLLMFSLIPGLPTVPFMALGIMLGSLAYYLHQKDETEREPAMAGGTTMTPEQLTTGQKPKELKPPQESVEKLLKVDMMGLEIGYGLIPLVNTKQGSNILERIKSIRKQLAMEMGIIVPPVRIRDNLQLRPNQYQILIKGLPVATGDLLPNHHLAMNPGTATSEIEGIPTKEPAFGLDAYWIKESQKDQANIMGYTVVDLQTVVTTHISEMIKSHAHELLGRQETQALLNNLAETYPKIVEDLIPAILPLGTVQKVLKNLLIERVSIRDLLSILETLAEYGLTTQDATILTELVRQQIGRNIVQPFTTEQDEIHIISLSPEVEQLLTESYQQSESGNYIALEPQMAQRFLDRLQNTISNSAFAIQPILLVNANLRQPLRKLLERILPNLVILSHNEIPSHLNIITVGVVGS
ncbi:MAG: flagellar biosynthesis protein FlhA [Acidobacteria bacterium]|nr:MAG: flagellar biosynthesis protein FlhA [Acidobacteriota bacterium]